MRARLRTSTVIIAPNMIGPRHRTSRLFAVLIIPGQRLIRVFERITVYIPIVVAKVHRLPTW
jgi:hypothetical protein